jgi:hypothetical protein
MAPLLLEESIRKRLLNLAVKRAGSKYGLVMALGYYSVGAGKQVNSWYEGKEKIPLARLKQIVKFVNGSPNQRGNAFAARLNLLFSNQSGGSLEVTHEVAKWEAKYGYLKLWSPEKSLLLEKLPPKFRVKVGNETVYDRYFDSQHRIYLGKSIMKKFHPGQKIVLDTVEDALRITTQ